MSYSRDDVLGMTEAYVHDLLSSEDRRYVEAEAERSAVWREALAAARRREALLQSAPVQEPSDALLSRAFTAAAARNNREESTRRLFTRAVPIGLAAAIGLLLCLQAFFALLAPTGYDLVVLGQRELAAGGASSLRVRLQEPGTGRPVAGVPVEVSLDNGNGDRLVLATFTTDAHGTGSPRYTLPEWTPGEYSLVVRAGKRERIERTVLLTRPLRLMLSTDKPVYQPGQTIRARMLALRRADGKLLAGEQVVFTVSDPKGTIIFKHRTVTSRFGIAWADCPLATEILHGAYSLKCSAAGTESERTLDVRPYTLPKFRIDVDLAEPYLHPGQLVRATVNAEYYFGQAVSGAVEVEMSAIQGGFSQRQVLTLGPEGSVGFEFRVPERLVGTERDDGDAILAITATVTDSGGQRESKRVERIVAAQNLRIEVLPESGVLVPGVANTIYILVTMPDGQPAPNARVAVSGLQEELLTSELGVASFELTPPQHPEGTDGPSMVVRAVDAAGRSESKTVNLSTQQEAAAFLLRTDAAVYSGGGTARIGIIGAGSEPVFLDLVRNGQTVLTRTIEMQSGQGELLLDLPSELAGTLQLVAYRFGSGGTPIRRTRAIIISPADDVRVTLETDKPEFKPGERATLSLQLTDATGRPKPGAISIAAVDEAVYGVVGHGGLSASVRSLDEELLRPVYAIYPWSMAARATPASRQLDQALFSATTRPGTDRAALLARLVDDGLVSEYMLDVLNSPQASAIIASLRDSGQISDAAAELLSGDSGMGAHSLRGSSWPEKVQRIEERRRAGHAFLKTAWIGVLMLAGLIGIAAMAIYAPFRLVEIVVVLLVVTLLIGIFLPALGKARRSSRHLREHSEMRGLGMALDMTGISGGDSATSGTAPRLRQWFPETLLWRPELITDDHGKVSLDVALADSITTWRVFGEAVTADGELGSFEDRLRVFQPFFVDMNLPVSLTRGDEVSIPVVVYNYLDRPQHVHLNLSPGAWFEIVGEEARSVKVGAGLVASASFTIRALRAGAHDLQVTATADGPGGFADAIRRTIEVLPGGRPIEFVAAGTTDPSLEAEFEVPHDLIDGSGRLWVKLYPSPFSQFVEGMDGIFQAPYGCFEQTSSTTYPNILALQYLKRTGKAAPGVELKARQYIHLGYQRLISFEVDGGGFDWFGRPPANRLLTAYGLMQFLDMNKVHDVDPELIKRTRRWLLSQRRSDGSWAAESRKMGSGPSADAHEDLVTTAYMAWAIYGRGETSDDATMTRQWLELARPESQSDPYVVALMVHALSSVDGDHRPWLRRLLQLHSRSADGKQVWWMRQGGRTAFYGSGHYGDIEASALATLALLRHGADPALANSALAWLIARRDPSGTWGTTQATVLALQSLITAAENPVGEQAGRGFSIQVGAHVAQRISIDPDQAEVMRRLDLSQFLAPGKQRITVRQLNGPPAQVQVVFQAAVPGGATAKDTDGPLDVEVVYASDVMRTGEELAARAVLTNRSDAALPMVMLELPVPPGFDPNRADFDAMVTSKRLARYEVTPRRVTLYLLEVGARERLEFNYSMRATLPVSASVDAPVAYEYYDPQLRAVGSPSKVTVQPAPETESRPTSLTPDPIEGP